MMPGLVVKVTNNNVPILECLTPVHEQNINDNKNKLETMEEIQQTECLENKTDEIITKEYQEISNSDVNTDTIKNRVPDEQTCTETTKNHEEIEELPDTKDVPKYPDKEPPEKIINNCENNSISVNMCEPSTSKLTTTLHKKQNKLKTFLTKYNVTESELILKLKNMKRLTKDKIKLDSVLSHKLNRNYMKILKRRRSIKNKIRFEDASSSLAYRSERVSAGDGDSADEYSTCESEDSGHEGTSGISGTTLESENKLTNNEEDNAIEQITKNEASPEISSLQEKSKILDLENEENTEDLLENKNSDINMLMEKTDTEQNEVEMKILDKMIENVVKIKEKVEIDNYDNLLESTQKENLETYEMSTEPVKVNGIKADILEQPEESITEENVQNELKDKDILEQPEESITEENVENEIKNDTLETEISKNPDPLIIDTNEAESSLNDLPDTEKNNSQVIEKLQIKNITTLLEDPETEFSEKQTDSEVTNKTTEFENTSIISEDQLETIKEIETVKKAHTETLTEEKSCGENSRSSTFESDNQVAGPSPLTIMPNLFEDDDIRNKIKLQLELLRRNTRKSMEPVEETETELEQNEEPETNLTEFESEPPQVEENKNELPENEEILEENKNDEVPEENENEEIITPQINTGADLSDVLISNEGDLAIINVVGGYISENEDDDKEHEQQEEENPEYEELKLEEVGKKQKRGISITDRLLMNFCQDNAHIIKPTKTTDITKIKGWRSKTFNVIPEEDIKSPSIEPPDEVPIEDDVPPLIYFKSRETSSSLEHPLPGTSSGFVEIPKIPEPLPPPPPPPQEEIKLPPESENKNSAFVSDYLETFLSTNSELKISYEVPKLVAEESISKPEELQPLLDYPPQPVSEKNTTTSYKPKQGALKKAKPKTLAEKRRMLELDRKNELLHDMETNEQIYLKRLEYCEKRNKTEIAEDIKNNLVANLVPFSRRCWKLATKEHRQYAVFNGQKIRLSGSSGGQDIVVPVRKLNNFNKTNNESNGVKLISVTNVRPGPLSKKHKLITQDNWECHVLKMPKIKLEVYPEQNKPLPLIAQQYLQLCRQDQYLVNKNWADFAVTAVRTKEKPEKINKFEFEIPYAKGRNRILVRRKIKNISPVKYPERTYSNRFPEINVDENIKDIVSDLLTCVENRELEEKIIKDDPDLDGLFVKNKRDEDRPPSPIDPRVQAIIKRPNARRSKTTLELRRLNVQVIEVDVKVDENIPENCMKDYCKLGCVCKSLRGASALIPEHCGRVECMLECTCSFGALQKGRHQITLPAGTDLLSASTVVRLQDEAKRNLAKVEREFTQTVIKANNQTIMVGGGARERTRRVPKVPKKYSNFAVDKPNPKGVSNYDKIMGVIYNDKMSEEEELIDIEMEKTPPKKKPEIEEPHEPVFVETKKPVPIWINKEKDQHKSLKIEGGCRVVLNKMKLDHVIPWCMVHNLYKCHCGGKATFADNSEPVKPVQTPIEETEYISYNPRFGGARHSDTIPHTVTPDIIDKYCARTKAVPTNFYHARNKSQRFKADYAVMRQIEEKNTHLEHVTITSNITRNKRKSLDSYETYSHDDITFDPQNLLVPMKKKSGYIKKRDYQSLLLPQNQNPYTENTEMPLKKPKIEEEDEDPLESVSLLDRLRDMNNIQTYKTYQKVPLDKITKMVRKPKKQKPKVIMRDPDKTAFNKTPPESLQLTSDDFTPESKPIFSPGDLRKRKLENTHIVSSTAFIDYNRSFMGLLVPSKEWLSKFHKMLNPNDNTIIHQIRLLEWGQMVKRQQCNALQIWFNTKKYNNIILTEDRRRPSKSHVNVKTFKEYALENFKIPDIIASLLAGKLPGAAQKASETYLILVFNGNCWEARGTIVLSGTTEICKQKLALRPTPVNILGPVLNDDSWVVTPRQKLQFSPIKKKLDSGSGTFFIKSTPSMSVEVRNNQETIQSPPVLSKPPLLTPASTNELEIISIPAQATSSPTITPDNSDKKESEHNIPVLDRSKYNIGSILAPLPTGGNLHRWFMLILENDFSVLRISFSKFHIKYTHLQTAINMARKSQKTVRIKTPPVNCPDVSENFSIYACPEGSQRIFFGPYGNRCDHGLETFRYVNGKLVNTKIYNKMRGNPEKKTSGYWFTHNATMNYNLNLEPNYDEGSSGSECATASTSIENVTKPQIELVDLTENDSECEEEKPKPSEIDPLLHLLSADFSKKMANDITIEAVAPNTQPRGDKPINYDMEIEAITDQQGNSLNKRKASFNQDISEEPVTKQPTLIDSIELDDDEDVMPVLEPYNKEQNLRKSPNIQMPPLRPINQSPKEKDKFKSKNKCLYVITNIPGVGYFEIFFERTKSNRQSMYTIIKNSKTTFQTINNAIKYLHYLCTKCIYFMPKTLKVKFSIVDSSEPPDMPKFKDEFLSGYHMISERGIFNILNINTKDLDNLGFDEEEIQKLLSYKCDLLIARNIKQLGIFLFGHEAARKMPQDEILRMAPGKIKVMEQQESNLITEKNIMIARQQNLLDLLNDLQRNIPDQLRNMIQQKITNILGEKTPNLNESFPVLPDLKSINPQRLDSPAVVKPINKPESPQFTLLGGSAMITKTSNSSQVGKFCRIVDGKLIVLDNSATKTTAPSGVPRRQPQPQQPSVNILSPQQFQNLVNPNPDDVNSKFELLVPITGLQSPATLVTCGQNSAPSKMLVANTNCKKQPKVVDLTDD